MVGHLALFEGCDRRELGRIARLMGEVEVAQGAVLTARATPAGDFLRDHRGRGPDIDRDGEILARLGEGAFFGELSLLDGGPRSATVTAASPMFVL